MWVIGQRANYLWNLRYKGVVATIHMQTAGFAKRMERTDVEPSLLRTDLILTLAENDIQGVVSD